jgi:hypothetical protein
MNITTVPSFWQRIAGACKIPFLIAACFLLLGSCTNKEASHPLEPIVETWYKIYQERNDFQKFLSLYDDEVILEDIILGERKVGKADFANFFDWKNPAFSKVDTATLFITASIMDGREAALKGYFTNFKWGDTTFEAMHFTTLLRFNEAGKIIKQVDWINYPNELVDYSSRKNANDWLKK